MGRRPRRGRRIIPARAGFTRRSSPLPTPPRDHPRSRGVYWEPSVSTAAAPGSSPLARGLPAAIRRLRADRGIIPARAGFTHLFEEGHVSLSDHPRSRGVYFSGQLQRLQRQGSSPLARGLHDAGSPARAPVRIIPARAGFTAGRNDPLSRGRDHPRSRGVYNQMRAPPRSLAGSSPLARGLRQHRLGQPRLPGIIPARAGFTDRWPSAPALRPDHPRSRGVYPCCPGMSTGSPGSSPLARGLRWTHPRSNRHSRIIPARAGFTGGHRLQAARCRDHPRSRGVYR